MFTKKFIYLKKARFLWSSIRTC